MEKAHAWRQLEAVKLSVASGCNADDAFLWRSALAARDACFLTDAEMLCVDAEICLEGVDKSYHHVAGGAQYCAVRD